MRTVRFAFLLLAVLFASCTSGVTPNPTSSPGNVVSSIPSSAGAVVPLSPTPLPLTFHASASQARMVATVLAFIDAYNAGRVDAALAVLAPDVHASDCDYRTASPVFLDGTDAVRQWLRDRAADHDQLVLESIVNENPDPTARGFAVSYGRRTSDTLRSLGFSAGVIPRLATKVAFTASDDRIRAFGNGGNSEFCRPRS